MTETIRNFLWLSSRQNTQSLSEQWQQIKEAMHATATPTLESLPRKPWKRQISYTSVVLRCLQIHLPRCNVQ